MIVFRDVSKHYPHADGQRDAVHGLDFSIAAGELVIVTGHSGAGKSTLLNLIAGLERPTEGQVLVGGQDVGRMPRSALPWLRRNLGLVLQQPRLLADRSAWENVMLPLRVTGYPRRDAARRVAAALDKVGLHDHAHALPAALSGGEQQRLAIARAIVNRPAILIADEPTANLDADYARDIMAMFRSFQQVGVTVLVSTHHPQQVAHFRPRYLQLDSGQLIRDGHDCPAHA